MKKKHRLHPEDVKLITENVVTHLQDFLKNKTEKKWIPSKEVVKLLGVSNSKLHQMRCKNLITYSSFGRNIYYNVEDIHLILEQNKVERIRT
ncbi:helix-turn-helix domain-containing protein [Empedobacter sp. UBA5987]|uniref:helix-turn-helix domain-containing protein n=1 Tax=Empedobacter sp. UBA5987 TaxID=1946444 RepID=UPI0025C583E8|nr:helix-turn-helix domain-containing protein [Empedobacter sp. UBA5987]